MKRAKQTGFTIVELLIVVVVIGVLATIIIVSYSGAQSKAKDARRQNDMHIISGALNLYKSENFVYPTSSLNGPGGWETSSVNPNQFLLSLKTKNDLATIPVDPINTTAKAYWYYRYDAGSYGCDVKKGGFFILGVLDMESTVRPDAKSPGFSCPTRDWQTEFDWVTGGFEN